MRVGVGVGVGVSPVGVGVGGVYRRGGRERSGETGKFEEREGKRDPVGLYKEDGMG